MAPQDPAGGDNAIFGIDMFYQGGGKYLVNVNYGADFESWYKEFTQTPYCDIICDPSGADNATLADGDFNAGVFLPNGALIGSSYPGVGPATASASFAYPGYTFTLDLAGATTVPEPPTWALAILGVGAIGWRLRKRANAAQVAEA